MVQASQLENRVCDYVVVIVALGCALILTWQAWVKAPAHDEIGQFYASVATVRFGDPGFYRVNPPLHRWVTGLPVEWLCDVPIPKPYPASHMPPGMRQEYVMGTSATASSPDRYRWHFFVGRLPRILIVLASVWIFLKGFVMFSKRSRSIAAILYLTSPLVLGHGWTTMPDALSACAMLALVSATLVWLNHRTFMAGSVVGIAWGICLNVKFTFCPIFLLWPLVLVLHEWHAARLTGIGATRLGLAHFAHGVIALWITIVVYEGNDIGLRLSEHRFASQTFRDLASLAPKLHSPLPAQYLIGIDEQQLFLDRGVPTYFAGQVYPDGMWWYYIAGLLAKEQIVFGAACVVLAFWLIVVVIQRRRRTLYLKSDIDDSPSVSCPQISAIFFLLGVAALVITILSWNWQLALNVRYLLPAMPAIYLLLGTGIDGFLKFAPRFSRMILAGGLMCIGMEVAMNFPHFFAYINPCFGGSYRIPPVLHDSNTDGGQDIWILEQWNRDHPTLPGTRRYFAYFTNISRSAIDLPDAVPSVALLEELLQLKTNKFTANEISVDSWSSAQEETIEIVIAHCLQVPAPWHRLSGESERFHQLLEQTSTLAPDEFITPSMLLYRFCLDIRRAESGSEVEP